jgi:hypothetical protein
MKAFAVENGIEIPGFFQDLVFRCPWSGSANIA